ncbi:MAG: hypothetical protein JW818_08080 [Pirellulales bacterium]|nr:hypothetical protein [Pirellulales bacterium]
MNVGIVASSNGSAWSCARELLSSTPGGDCRWLVVTDRPCGIEETCRRDGLTHTRIELPDNGVFSRAATDWFAQQGGVDFVLLFFLRLVTADLFTRYPTLNLHPSLLPAFRGFNPLRQAIDERVRFLGATLHLIDAQADAGPIVAQVVMPLAEREPLEQLERYSFIQKIYLTLLAVDLFRTGAIRTTDDHADFELTSDLPRTDRCNPRLLDSALWDGMLTMQAREGLEVIR